MGDHQPFQHRIAHALARFQHRPFFERLFIPFIVPGAHHRRPVGFGQAVDVGDLEIHPLHAFDHGGGRGRAGGHHLDPMRDAGFHLIRRVLERVQHDRRAAEMVDFLFLDQIEHQVGADLTEANVGAHGGGDGPGEAPAVAVEHRQGP